MNAPMQEVETEVTEGQYTRAFVTYCTFNIIAGVAAVGAMVSPEVDASVLSLLFAITAFAIAHGLSNDGWCHRFFWSKTPWTLREIDTDDFKDNDVVTVTRYE